MNRPCVLLCVSLFVCCANVAAARTLQWKELDVRADLQRDGTLRVRERHALEFTGDWNGGERRFNVREGQTLKIDRMTRTDSSGAVTEVLPGSLNELNRYELHDDVLRWRARMPQDPAFDHTRIDYTIEYALTGVLVPHLGKWVLAHDFAFPDREADIDRFRLNFTIDPSWQLLEGGALHTEGGPIAPGKGFVVKAAMTGGTLGTPSLEDVARHFRELLERQAMTVGVAVFLALSWLVFVYNEKANGRFVKRRQEQTTWEWAEQHLAAIPAEVAATIAEGRTTSRIVPATLARMEVERKIASSANSSRFMRMQLLVPKASLTGYEADLAGRLFVNGDVTDSDRIREHYKNVGFDPQRIISFAVQKQAEETIGERAPAIPQLLGTLAALAGVAAGIAFIALLVNGENSNTPVSRYAWAEGIGAALLFIAVGRVYDVAVKWKEAGDGDTEAWAALPKLVLPGLAAVTATAIAAVFSPPGTAGLLFAAFFAFLGCGLIGYLFTEAATKEGPRRRDWIRRMKEAARLLEKRISRQEPLDESWVPYAIAFGVQGAASLTVAAPRPLIDPRREEDQLSRNRDDGRPAAPEPAHLTAGGGAFGGAGATGSWTDAAAALSVAAPSAGTSSSSSSSDWGSSDSSFSSGSSDSSSSSSGGGGGGGW